MKYLFATAGLLVMFAGCASAPQSKPTHYWESPTASENKYRADEQSCQQRAGSAGQHFPQFDASSESYEAYRSCMIEQGYVLRQY
jgi:hypothetical protein